MHTFSISAFHRVIRIVATSVVETDRTAPLEGAVLDRWPLPESVYDTTTYDYLQFDGPITHSPELAALVNEIRPKEGSPLFPLALSVLRLIPDRFTYFPGVTTAASPVSETLTHGKGVCQDFTHLMIAIARELKVPARYVSGLLHPDAGKFRGHTQTHAWAELYFPSTGWIGFDPTNRTLAGPNFVKVAVGRDFRDVSPNRGLYRGMANESIDVKVHSEELKSVPAELAAERMQNLDVPYYLDGSPAHRELIAQQQQVQQQ